jgi:hypothetical protein
VVDHAGVASVPLPLELERTAMIVEDLAADEYVQVPLEQIRTIRVLDEAEEDTWL